MNTIRSLAGVALALALALAHPAFAADVGQVKVSKGSVQIERAGARMPAPVGTRIQESDTVSTGADGSVGITFDDGTMMSAGPNTVLAVSRFAFNPTTHAGALETSLRTGTLSVVSGKIAKQSPEAMKIHAPAAILGVRGTEFFVQAVEPGK